MSSFWDPLPEPAESATVSNAAFLPVVSAALLIAALVMIPAGDGLVSLGLLAVADVVGLASLGRAIFKPRLGVAQRVAGIVLGLAPLVISAACAYLLFIFGAFG